MSWLGHPFDQFSPAWLILSALVGGVIGSGTRFLFEDVLRPRLGWRRDARHALHDVSIPLLRAAETLERQINNMVRNADKGWYASSEYYRLSTLYTFGEYLGFARIIELRFSRLAIESSRSGRRFNDRLNGLYRALTSFAYFRWCTETDAIEASLVPRRMMTAIGECMIVDGDGTERVRSFTDFCVKHETDPQFARWFRDLDDYLRQANKQVDTFRWDRLIAAGANLRALVVELDGRRLLGSGHSLANLDRICHHEVRQQLEKEFSDLVPSIPSDGSGGGIPSRLRPSP